MILKIHIFKNSDYTFCGRHQIDIGTLGHLSDMVTEKGIKNLQSIHSLVCKSCINNWRKWKDNEKRKNKRASIS